MSEVLHAKVTESEKHGISRRRVVAGVAWSLPVIATAIAAPAAAASGYSATAALVGQASIKPSGTVTAGAGIQSIGSATLTAAVPAYTNAFEYNATFTYAGGVTSGQTLTFPLSFQYQRVTPAPSKTTYSYTLTITLRLPDGTDRIMAGTVTVAY